MTQQTYLLELVENAGENEFLTRHLIDAKDAQMVKYHFHRTMKDIGYSDTQWGKHCLESWDLGLQTEIHNIKMLEPIETQVLEEHLPHWTKV